jgi:hypothetical protein
MDFKSLISKLDSMEAPPQTPAAPQLDKAVQLNEDAQLRVLSGRTTYVAEAKKKKEEDKKEEKKVDEAAEKTSKPWKDSSGKEHPGTAVKGDKYTGKEAEKETKPKSKKDESVEPQFKSKFMKMVEAAKEQSEAEQAEAKEKLRKKKEKQKKEIAKIVDESVEEGEKKCPPMSQIKKMCEKKMSVAEICKKHPDCNQKELKQMIADCTTKLKEGTDQTGDGKSNVDDVQVARMVAGGVPKKKAIAKATTDNVKEEMSDKQAKYFGKKKTVKESIENILSFKDMIKLVQESGGQQQIDAVDQELFSWAQRVAKQKIGEGLKADVYAGMVYERMGGVFEMYDVLSEDRR